MTADAAGPPDHMSRVVRIATWNRAQVASGGSDPASSGLFHTYLGGAAARSVPSKSVFEIGPMQGIVAPASA